MTPTARVLASLVAGLAIGIGISSIGSPALLSIVTATEPIGTLWVNAIRMTVIPLVVSLLVCGITGGGSGTVGRIGMRALVLFLVMAGSAAAFAALVAPLLLAGLPVDPAAAHALGRESGASTVTLPPFGDWVAGLIPANPARAAVDGAMLPLTIFTALAAFALGRTAPQHRTLLVDLARAVSETMFVLVRWILAVAPVGIFFLSLSLATRMGAQLAGALGYFLVVVSGLLIVSVLALYPIAVFLGGVPLGRFARACAPAQAVGFGTRSSLAALPAMVDGCERILGLPTRVTGIVLPVAVSIFKFSSPIARLTGTLLVARLYGIELSGWELAAIAASICALSFYSPGIPSGGLFVMAPVYTSFGLPIEGIGLLIALDMIPDLFMSTSNVTADMTVAVLLSRGFNPETPPEAAEPEERASIE